MSESEATWRSRMLVRLALEASALEGRLRDVGGLEGLAGELRLVRTQLEQAARLEGE